MVQTTHKNWRAADAAQAVGELNVVSADASRIVFRAAGECRVFFLPAQGVAAAAPVGGSELLNQAQGAAKTPAL